jgi:hypothetical protein
MGRPTDGPGGRSVARPSEDRAARRLRRVHNSIDVWRQTRQMVTPMPKKQWTKATELAECLGTWPVARDLYLSYDSLKRRVEEKAGSKPTSAPRFVEMRGSNLMGVSRIDSIVVELYATDGTRMTERLGEGKKVDLPALVGAFRRGCVPAMSKGQSVIQRQAQRRRGAPS